MKIIVFIAALITIFQVFNSFGKGRAAESLCNGFILLTLAALLRYYI